MLIGIGRAQVGIGCRHGDQGTALPAAGGPVQLDGFVAGGNIGYGWGISSDPTWSSVGHGECTVQRIS